MRKAPISFESGNLETLKRLVEQNFGMTLMPQLAVSDADMQCATGILKEFDSPVPSRKIRLVYSREYLKKNLIDAFAQEIKDAVPEELKQQKEELIVE